MAIALVNVINGLFSLWQEYKAEKAIDALRRKKSEATAVASMSKVP